MTTNCAEDLLQAIVLSIGEALGSDPSRPSVTVSHLGAPGWYVSVCRYTQPYGDGKVTVCSARATELRAALVELETKWGAHVLNPKSPAAIRAAPGVGEQACDRHDLVAALEASIALATQTKDPDTLRTVRKAVQAAGVRPVERERLLSLLGAE